MKDNMKNLVRGFGQIAVSVIVAIVFICIAKFVLRGYFYNTCMPVSMDYGEWADYFVSLFTIASVVAMILNILYVVLAAFAKGFFLNAGGWFFELILSIIIGVVFSVVFTNAAPEETSCLTIACVMFVLEYILVFFIGSFFADKFNKYQYNPILGLLNRAK